MFVWCFLFHSILCVWAVWDFQLVSQFFPVADPQKANSKKLLGGGHRYTR